MTDNVVAVQSDKVTYNFQHVFQERWLVPSKVVALHSISQTGEQRQGEEMEDRTSCKVKNVENARLHFTEETEEMFMG